MSTGPDGLGSVRRVMSVLRALPPHVRRVAMRRLVETRGARARRWQRVTVVAPDRLVVVCHGNIMRSAFAVAYLQQQAPHVASRIVGAGTHAVHGRGAQDSALRVAPAFGVPLDAHQAQPLEVVALRPADVIVCMDRANEAHVVARYPFMADRVFLIGDGPADFSHRRVVQDPYARGDAATHAAFQQIVEQVPRWLTVITVPHEPAQ